MADVAVSVQTINRAGLEPAYTGSLSTSNNYIVPNDGTVFLHFKKTNAVDATVTIVTTKTVDGLAVADRTDTVPNTDADGLFVGPFPRDVYGNSLDVSFDDIDGLSMAAFQLG